MSARNVPPGWRRVPIKETWDGLFDGLHATPALSDVGPVFLGIGNLTGDGHLDLSNVRYIAEDDFPKWTKRVEPKPGDIVFTYEATLNRYAIIPDGFRGCLGRRLALIRPNRSKVDTRFLFYSFFGSDWRATIERNRLSGATVDRIPIAKFPDFPINLPSLQMQRRIADILSAYDDLIEVNTRRIAILEETARRLFDEWFVKFRFPGHATAKIVETSIGLAPRNWDIKEIGHVWEVVGGGTPSKAIAEYWEDGTIDWYTPSDLTGAGTSFMNGSSKKITPKGLCESSARLFPAFSVMMTSRATLGVIAINTSEATTNQGFITCVPNENGPLFFLFHWLKANEAEFERHASGATFKEITKGTFKKLPIALPPPELTRGFDDRVGSLMHQSRVLQASNRNLRAQRDLLLPKLISGEIDVSSAERAVKQVAAE